MCAVVLVAAALGTPPAAAQETALRSHLDPILTAAPDTPGGDGLLTVALAEAWVALQQARLAAAADADLAAVQRHARGVLHALDPQIEATGPGGGYGLRRAIAGIAERLAPVAATVDPAGAGRLAPPALATVERVDRWVDALVAVAQRTAAATSLADAQAASGELLAVARQLTFGRGGAGEGRAAFGSGEPGLLAVHTTLRTLAAHSEAQAAAEARR